VVAEIVTAVVPRGVAAAAENNNVTVVGNADIEADGVKLQVTPAGIPLLGQASVTVPLNDPALVIANVMGPELLPCCTEILAGEGAPTEKSTTWRVTAASCVSVAASVPTPCTLNE
jgi:hypothetical protein